MSDLRSDQHFTLKQNPLRREHLQERGTVKRTLSCGRGNPDQPSTSVVPGNGCQRLRGWLICCGVVLCGWDEGLMSAVAVLWRSLFRIGVVAAVMLGFASLAGASSGSFPPPGKMVYTAATPSSGDLSHALFTARTDGTGSVQITGGPGWDIPPIAMVA